MAQLDRISQAAFKKLFGLGSTEVKTFPIGNESDPSSVTTIARDVFAEPIAATAAAVAGRIVDCTNATDATATSRLTLTVNPAEGAAEGIAYYVTVPASHGLIGQTNPYDGSVIASGDRVRAIIPKKFGTTWRPIVYGTAGVEIPPLDSSDWFLDERAGIVFFGTAPSITPLRLACYVYVGKTLADVFFPLTTKSASYTATVSDGVILCSGTFTVTLYTAVGNTGKVLNIKNTGTGTITVDAAGSETIDGGLTAVLRRRYESISLVSDGINWEII